ncbi:MAG: PleD family two-component system response regulator [Bacteroidota bacterium]
MNRERTVLVVDDEPDVVEILSYNLNKAGYTVRTCTDSTQALSIARELKPHLVLLDIRMPDLNGIDVCRSIKADSGLFSTPVVFLTADSDDYTTFNALSAGGDHFITKPIHPRLVISIVDELVNRDESLID